MKKFTILAFVGLVAALLFLPAHSFALTVGPGKLEYTLDPGATMTGTLFLLNEGTESQTLHPSFEAFTETNGTKQFFPETTSDLVGWFTVASSVTLAPKESTNIPFTLSVPKGAPPGGHFAVIWWNTAPVGSKAGSAAIVTRAGILVYLNVTGQVNESGSITRFAPTNGGRFLTGFPTSFDVMFNNTGGDYLQPTGDIQITNMFGASVASFSVNKNNSAQILPQSEKDLPVSLDPPQGNIGFGIYHAELTLHYGESNKEIGDSYTFVVVTWVLLPILLALLLIVFGIVLGVRKYNQWVIRKATMGKENEKGK